MVTSHDGLGDETGILQQLAARRVVVLDVSVGKRYKYSLLSENLIVRGKHYAERT